METKPKKYALCAVCGKKFPICDWKKHQETDEHKKNMKRTLDNKITTWQ